MKLTTGDIAFLSRAGYSTNDVCDVTAVRTRDIDNEVKKNGKKLGFGNPCTNGGHRLKWPSGHCAPCKPIYKTFRQRFSETKFIYIAGSLKKRLIKIGVGDNPSQRVAALSRTEYAGARDWELLFKMQVSNAGRLEHDALSHLDKHSRQLGYLKDGRQQLAIEALDCSYLTALSAIARFATIRSSAPWQSERVSLYDFEG